MAIFGLCAQPTLALGQTSIAWQSDDAIGPNEVDLVLTLSCSGDPATCAFFDGYWDMQTSLLAGAGALQLDPVAGTIRFETDSQQDLDDGLGLRDAFLTLVGTDVDFAGIPFYGVPEVVAPTFFALDDPLVPIPGFDLSVPGDYPFSTPVSEAAIADITGALSLQLPMIVVPAQSVTLTGVMRVRGDIDFDGRVELELRDLSLDAQVTEQFTDLGVVLDVTVDASLTANLRAEIDAPDPQPIPLLGAAGRLAVAMGLGALGWLVARRRPRA